MAPGTKPQIAGLDHAGCCVVPPRDAGTGLVSFLGTADGPFCMQGFPEPNLRSPVRVAVQRCAEEARQLSALAGLSL
jgi:hypothetical protein